MPAHAHFLDIEFNEELKKLFITLFPNYQPRLLKYGLVKKSLDDYKDDGEASYEKPYSVAEKFWMLSQGAVRYYLLREKNYKCYGTRVWLQLPTEGDVAAWYDDLLSPYTDAYLDSSSTTSSEQQSSTQSSIQSSTQSSSLMAKEVKSDKTQLND